MTRRFVVFTVGLTACVSFMVGMVVTGSMSPSDAVSAPAVSPSRAVRDERPMVPGIAGVVNFADVAERLNPAVVNIDASSRSRRNLRPTPKNGRPPRPDPLDDPLDNRRRGEPPRRGAGTGFLIDEEGHILTNHHVIEGADRITVKLSDGRSLRAEVIGFDPDTDIALIKVQTESKLPHAVLGDSDDLRVGEWVCAIGNPLAYEHTVTVGVVSFMGRKLFDMSLDDYIQTDAAINFGNSGGPLINARGEVIGINSAISRQASSIGFAVPINQAKLILPQLKATGVVSRGYIGVALRDVDPDLQVSLKLPSAAGALVQDVTAGSPAERAGLRPYDLITAVDNRDVTGNNGLIREIAAREPGSSARLEVMRDGRVRDVIVKLAERSPTRTVAGRTAPTEPRLDRTLRDVGPGELGLTVIEIDESNAHRFDVPPGTTGLLVQRVEPMSAAHDALIERGQVILEINRRPVDSVAGFRRILSGMRAGEAMAVFIYIPEIDQKNIRTVRMDPR
ncbi:MAG: trypsin-like peptidase domain-containing protein [Vicinamibacterales bacterium]